MCWVQRWGWVCWYAMKTIERRMMELSLVVACVQLLQNIDRYTTGCLHVIQAPLTKTPNVKPQFPPSNLYFFNHIYVIITISYLVAISSFNFKMNQSMCGGTRSFYMKAKV